MCLLGILRKAINSVSFVGKPTHEEERTLAGFRLILERVRASGTGMLSLEREEGQSIETTDEEERERSTQRWSALAGNDDRLEPYG